ncbi:probable LRR receptor-like serine/threonine-protein kinase At1g14390 isoform X2 [Lotus japonicus]|uniref:probable LRR receptor-like serine/threonine-protein kinase At1g14390 isoform X2 n=1 Tax=Lotus japonicus TaxID=34305 RepID=UPI00258A13C1|nr:probable LRR receptor-like serine/threonine-protein kinase At1g14390 isoform X2 [Lotus japonicus]
MKKLWNIWLIPAIILLILVLAPTTSIAQQLTTTENRILFQVQKFLEYPQGLQEWTNFCFLPPSPSLKIVCSNGHVTELTIIGNKTSLLSGSFSIDSFFTVITKLSNLKVLSLVSLGLWGPLPAKINRFSSLQVLNMSSNFIHGEIPSLKLKNLTSLVLADNLFNGSVPPDLETLTCLEELNLGGNKLGSHFPSFLFSLPSLHQINLSSNHLSGNLSMPCAPASALTFVDISHNLLVGKLPSCIIASKAEVLYSGNCLLSVKQKQRPPSYCNKKAAPALAVKPPSSNSKEKESGIKLGLLLGLIGGGIVLVGIAGLLLLLLLIFNKSKAKRSYHNSQTFVAHKFSPAVPNVNVARRVPQTTRLAAIGLPPYRIFTSEEIEDATNNFDASNLIEEGTQGQLYKGWLRDGSVVLVNCAKIKHRDLPYNSSIMQHLEILPNLRHRHMVSVVGHSVITHQDPPQSTTTVFIVFEYISNVSLRDQLTDRRKREILKWPQRMAISIGIARGVQFLHTEITPAIFGNNLKIHNILLDDSLNAKLSGYNIPLPSKEDNLESTHSAEKEDIYLLGVILLEVITGRQIATSSEVQELKDELETGSSDTASILLRSAIDPSLRGSYAYESMRTAVQITINCLSKVPSKRPSIEDVLWNLHYSMQVQESWTSSGNLSTKL